MTDHTATYTPPLLPAVGAQVQRVVRPLDLEAIRFLASGQDDPHSVALLECVAEIERLRELVEVEKDLREDWKGLAEVLQNVIDHSSLARKIEDRLRGAA